MVWKWDALKATSRQSAKPAAGIVESVQEVIAMPHEEYKALNCETVAFVISRGQMALLLLPAVRR